MKERRGQGAKPFPAPAIWDGTASSQSLHFFQRSSHSSPRQEFTNSPGYLTNLNHSERSHPQLSSILNIGRKQVKKSNSAPPVLCPPKGHGHLVFSPRHAAKANDCGCDSWSLFYRKQPSILVPSSANVPFP